MQDIRKRLKAKGCQASHLSHAEGLHAGFSGLHPLQALLKSQDARDGFSEIADAWLKVILRCTCKNFTFDSTHALALWEALHGKAPVAYRVYKGRKKVCIARAYNCMSLARSCAQLLPILFHRSVEGYFRWPYLETFYSMLTLSLQRLLFIDMFSSLIRRHCVLLHKKIYLRVEQENEGHLMFLSSFQEKDVCFC